MQPEIHPIAAVFPMMDAESFERLKADIAENGQRESTVYWRKMLVDGRNRDKACRELGIEPHECELDDDSDPVAFVLSANLHRRHLTISQNAICAARLATLPQGRPSVNSSEVNGFSLEASAHLFKVSRTAAAYAKRVVDHGCDALIALCESGELKVTPAAEFVAAVPDEKQQAAICKQGVESIEAATKKAKDQPKEPQPEIVNPVKDVVPEVFDADADVEDWDLAERLGEDFGVSARQIVHDGQFAAAVDKLGLALAIRAGVPFDHTAIVAAARKLTAEGDA